MSRNFQGIYAAITTPFERDFQLVPDQIAPHLNNLYTKGCHGVLVGGTTGEAPSMSVTERTSLFKAVNEHNPGLRLLAGTGAASLEDAVVLTRNAFDSGFEAAVIIPPFFYANPPVDGLVTYFEIIMKKAVPRDGAVLLYHNPFISGVGVSHDLVRRLRDRYPTQIYGIKDSSQDWDHFKELRQTFPDFQVLVGDDKLLSRALKMGGVGAITGLANLHPNLLRTVFDRFHENRIDDEAQNELTAAWHKLDGLPRIPAIKTVLAAKQFLPTATVRPPLHSLSEDSMRLLAERFPEIDM